MNYLEEVWGVYPVGLEKVDQIEDVKLYSSQKLVEKIIKAISQQIPEVQNSISALIKNQIIMPVFLSKGSISLFVHKAFAEPIDKGILGFFEPEKNRIFIILDNNSNFLSYSSNKRLTEVVIHECMHYAMQNYKNQTYNQFKEELIIYYSTFFKKYYNLSDAPKKKAIEDYLQYLLKNFELNKKFKNKINIDKYEKHLQNIANDEDKSYQLIKVLTNYLDDPNNFMRKAQSGNQDIKEVVGNLVITYDKIFEIKPDTLAIQELIFPSEVISILTYNPLKKHFRMVSYLAKQVE